MTYLNYDENTKHYKRLLNDVEYFLTSFNNIVCSEITKNRYDINYNQDDYDDLKSESILILLELYNRVMVWFSEDGKYGDKTDLEKIKILQSYIKKAFPGRLFNWWMKWSSLKRIKQEYNEFTFVIAKGDNIFPLSRKDSSLDKGVSEIVYFDDSGKEKIYSIVFDRMFFLESDAINWLYDNGYIESKINFKKSNLLRNKTKYKKFIYSSNGDLQNLAIDSIEFPTQPTYEKISVYSDNYIFDLLHKQEIWEQIKLLLNKKYHHLYEMYYKDGLSIPEIAEIFFLEKAKVQSIIWYSNRKIKHEFKNNKFI
jgi:hypothetical protein